MDGRFNVTMNKTCFLVPGLNAGGIENYLLRFLNYLPEKKNVTVVVRNKKKGDLFHEFEKTGVNIHFQGVGFFNPVKWMKLYQYFKQQHFQTICDFTGNFAGIPLLVARIAGIKNRIAFYRRSSNAFKETPFRLVYSKFLNRLVYIHATKILSNSQYALDFFFKYRKPGDERFKIIPNGVDASKFQTKETKEDARRYFKIPENSFVIGHVGRYDPAKNHETIFKVASILTKRFTNIVFLFCGRETNSPEFLAQLKTHEIENASFPLGLQVNLPLVYKTMDLFYFPSVTEGQPNALIEAMMAGIPVVASEIPPIKEVIPERGYLFLLNPLKEVDAVNVLSEIYLGNLETSHLTFKDDAIENFNIKNNFSLFYEQL